MAQKITHWLLVTLVLSLGFGQLLRFELFGLPLYLHDMLVICFLVAQGLTCDWRTVLKRNSWLQAKKGSSADERTVLTGTIGLKLFLLGLAVGWVFALFHYPLPPLLVPSLYTLRLLAYLALYLILNHKSYIINQKYFYISGMIAIIIGLAQYIFMPDMRLFQYLGWDDHLSRLTLPHFDPTFTATMLALAFLSTSRQLPSTIYYLPSILLTYSRSTWLSLGITFSYFMFKKKKFNFLIIGICLLIIPILFLPKKFGEGTNLLRTFSITSRFQADFSYVAKYKWDLLVGRGMNTLILDAPSSLYPNHATGPNNSYLYLLLTSGILGLVGWGIFMHSLYLDSHFKPMLTFFLIASLFNNVMFYPFALLWILLVEATVPTSV